MSELAVDRILRILTERGADFVIIGGIAAVLHGSARNTFDLDICFATDRANLEALGAALVDLGARPRGLSPDDGPVPFHPDAHTLRKAELLTLSTRHGDLDVLSAPPGAPRYDVLRRNADRFDVGGFVVHVASIDDLIAMKTAADRERDRLDVRELQAIKRVRRRIARRERGE